MAELFPYDNVFGENVRFYRKKIGMSQSELAEICGYKSRVSICHIENGQVSPHTSMVNKIAEALHVRVIDLLVANEDDYKLHDFILRAKGQTVADLLMEISKLSEAEIEFVSDFVEFLIAKKKKSP